MNDDGSNVPTDTNIEPPTSGLGAEPLADAPVSIASSPIEGTDALYQLTQTDVSSLLSFAASLAIELYVIIALLLIVAGLLFGSIATRFWKVG